MPLSRTLRSAGRAGFFIDVVKAARGSVEMRIGGCTITAADAGATVAPSLIAGATVAPSLIAGATVAPSLIAGAAAALVATGAGSS